MQASSPAVRSHARTKNIRDTTLSTNKRQDVSGGCWTTHPQPPNCAILVENPGLHQLDMTDEVCNERAPAHYLWVLRILRLSPGCVWAMHRLAGRGGGGVKNPNTPALI